jgi:acetolactate synthase-1/2/3 large subunit
MNGAESLLRTLAAAGVEVCFANPGTTEMPLVAALDAVERIRPVLGLFEGVCTGAADGYGRMAGRPAATLLHLGPGFANGIANLHNAHRAGTPVLNLIGDQATWHLPFDAPLASDIRSLATPVSSWVHTVRSAKELPEDGARALGACLSPPGHVATLIVPADCQWEPSVGPAAPPRPPRAAPADAETVRAVAAMLDRSRRSALFLGGRALSERGLRAAARVAARTHCRLVCETFPARLERGAGLPDVERLPYFPEQARESLASLADLVLVAAREPVAFFGYPGLPSRPAPESVARHVLARPEQDAEATLDALAEAVGGPARASAPRPPPTPAAAGPLSPRSLGAVLARLQPEGAVVVDEGIASSLPHFLAAAAAPPYTHLCLTGGAIGMGLPCATGAALACPDRRVIALQADGSGMYTPQALWTQAREGLDVTTVLLANRSYRILQIELARAGVSEPGRCARSLTELGGPILDWLALARGLGVPGSRATTTEELAHALERAFAEPGPHLIEAVLP